MINIKINGKEWNSWLKAHVQYILNNILTNYSSFQDGSPPKNMQVEKELQFLLNLHTGRSLAENTIADAVLIQFDFLMMSTELFETCRGL